MEEEKLLKSQSSRKELNDNDGLDLENQIYESSKGLTTKPIKWISGFLLLQLLFDVLFLISVRFILPLRRFILDHLKIIEFALIFSIFVALIIYYVISAENPISSIISVLIVIELLFMCDLVLFYTRALDKLIALITVAIIIPSLILYSLKTKHDFTSNSHRMVYVIVLLAIASIRKYVGVFRSMTIWTLFSLTGVLLFSYGIIIVTQEVMRKKGNSFQKSNVLLTSALIHIQIVFLFLFTQVLIHTLVYYF